MSSPPGRRVPVACVLGVNLHRVNLHGVDRSRTAWADSEPPQCATRPGCQTAQQKMKPSAAPRCSRHDRSSGAPTAPSADRDRFHAPAGVDLRCGGHNGSSPRPVSRGPARVDRMSASPIDSGGDEAAHIGGSGIVELDDPHRRQHADVMSQPRSRRSGRDHAQGGGVDVTTRLSMGLRNQSGQQPVTCAQREQGSVVEHHSDQRRGHRRGRGTCAASRTEDGDRPASSSRQNRLIDLIAISAAAAPPAMISKLTTEKRARMRYRACIDVHLILRRGEEILLSKRQNTGFADGSWHLPSGHTEDGESATAALIRETGEEIGLRIDPAEVRFVHLMHHRTDSGRIALFFEVTRWHGEPKNREPDKCASWDWFALTDLPAEMIHSVTARPYSTSLGRAVNSTPSTFHGPPTSVVSSSRRKSAASTSGARGAERRRDPATRSRPKIPVSRCRCRRRIWRPASGTRCWSGSCASDPASGR
jgi:8-oxo-dGTP diphosphatase